MLVLSVIFYSSLTQSYDCSKVPPFTPFEQQNVKVYVGRFSWDKNSGQPIENVEDVCLKTGVINAYDVRGGEADAFYCLKPQAQEVFTCATTLNGKLAEIAVMPVTWIRNWKPSDMREYHFHAYVMDQANSDVYQEAFARTLSFNLTKEYVITEGAIKNGPGEAQDGFFIRVEFQK